MRKQRLLKIWNDDSDPVGTGTQRPSWAPQTSSVSTHIHTHRLSLTNPYSLHLYHFFLGISQQTAGGHLCDCFVGESSTVGSGPKLPALTGLPHTSSISPHSVLPRGVALISCCTIHLTCFLRTAAALFHSSQNL